MESGYRFQNLQQDKGRCKLCAKKGPLLRGQLINVGIERSTSPMSRYVQVGPYCKEHGGRMRIEMDLAMLLTTGKQT
jgi:hypothetical protein